MGNNPGGRRVDATVHHTATITQADFRRVTGVATTVLRETQAAPTPDAAPPAATKLSRQDMDEMTKAELHEYASSLGLDVPTSTNKPEIIDAIAREQRKRG